MTRPTALITGGAGGIGAATAVRLAARGHRVAIADIDAARGVELAERIGGLFLPADIASPEDNERTVAAAVAAFGRLDAVVLNAGVAGRCGFHDFSVAAYRETMAIDLDGAVYGMNACLPRLREQGGGSIAVVSSLAGLTPSPDPFYSAAKHALIGLVGSAALLYAADGVRVNAVCPGVTDTPLISAFRAELLGAGILAAEPDEIAACVEAVLESEGTGEAWVVQAGRPGTRVPRPDLPVAGVGAAGRHRPAGPPQP
ncbi:SDR family NAD(P)-dependent oxidoreductase [Allonocardiopsis opalescens]|uniref:Short-subunit dehydrogenase n=1 Tax=Allonocardiopsis opalescens TaxID=1144618 RepID=A0A2T0QED3_9ACTN|nr:SDR family oxidoreductase [Allonocardiopsis opalescens]PRY02278.1 short-subunit dehydrogenase [Allonocardiopsis opalescens]